MDKRPPLCAVEDGNHPLLIGLRGEQIDYEVEARAIREAKDRCQTENYWKKVTRVRLQKRFFRINLGLSVKRNRLHGGVLIHQQLGGSVYAATRREHKALDAISSYNLYQHPGRGIIDLQAGFPVNFARRISYDGCEVDN